jgi:hypothetical protein
MFHTVVALVATLPLVDPSWTQSAQAADPPTTPPAARPITAAEVQPMDVVLATNNVLVGQVLDTQGLAIAETEVIVTQRKQEVARTLTNQLGEFAVTLPRGGVYLVFTNRSVQVVRTWTAAAAPPLAADRAVLSERDEVIRAQMGGRMIGNWGQPLALLVYAGIAAAIAVPIAINQHNKHQKTAAPSSP